MRKLLYLLLIPLICSFTRPINYPAIKVKNLGILSILNKEKIPDAEKNHIIKYISDFEYELKKTKWIHVYDNIKLKEILTDIEKGNMVSRKQLSMLIRPVYDNKTISFKIYTINKTNNLSYSIGKLPEIKYLANIIHKILPLEGEVIDISKDIVNINLGSEIGLKKGNLLSITKNNSGIAIIEVKDIFENSSRCKILKYINKINIGDSVYKVTYKLISDVNNKYFLNNKKNKFNEISLKKPEQILKIKTPYIKIFFSNSGKYIIIVDKNETSIYKIYSNKTDLIHNIKLEEILDIKFSMNDDYVIIRTQNYGLFLYSIPEGYIYQLNMNEFSSNDKLFRKFENNQYNYSILAAEWFNHLNCFLLLIKQKGLFFIDPLKKELNKIIIEGIADSYFDTAKGRLIINPDDINSIIIVDDIINNTSTSFLININDKRLLYTFDCKRFDTISLSPDQSKIIYFEDNSLKGFDHLFIDNRITLLKRINSTYKFSDSGHYIFVDSKHHLIYDTETHSQFEILSYNELLRDYQWYPNSDILFTSVIYEDSNKDGRLDWEDQTMIVYYDKETGNSKILNNNIDKFYGISPDGNYLIFRKGIYLYLNRINLPHNRLLQYKNIFN